MTQDFLLLVFLWNSFPQPQSIPLGPFQFFSKIHGHIRSSRLTTGVADTGGNWKKVFNQKNFNNFVGTPLDSRVNIYINFCLQVHFKVSSAWYESYCLPPVSLTPVANLPPVSTTLLKLVAKFATGVVDTCDKFTTGVVDTRGNFGASVVDTGGQPLAANISANFRKNSKRP